jgi:hypothetical protein
MASGPKIQPIVAGQALVADTVMQNFQSIVDYLRSIPANSLLQYRWTQTFSGAMGAIGAGATAYMGYHRVNMGASPEQIELTAVIERALQLAPGETVTLTWQKTTPANGSFPRFADVWAAFGGVTIGYNNANTAVGADNVLGDATRWTQRAILTGFPTVSDGDWIRCEVVTVGAGSACTAAWSDCTLKASLRT